MFCDEVWRLEFCQRSAVQKCVSAILVNLSIRLISFSVVNRFVIFEFINFSKLEISAAIFTRKKNRKSDRLRRNRSSLISFNLTKSILRPVFRTIFFVVLFRLNLGISSSVFWAIFWHLSLFHFYLDFSINFFFLNFWPIFNRFSHQFFS